MPSDLHNKKLKAEFDLLADNYYQEHKANISITGENPEYFSEYKISDFSEYFKNHTLPIDILDFGSGIGNSIPHFRKYFSNSKLCCADVSSRSMEISQERFPGNEKYLQIDDSIPAEDNRFDAIFTACVFHHIPHIDHKKWLAELNRVTKPNGVLAIFEHNPLNPLTVHAVNTCPIDANAKLIRAKSMKELLISTGWRNVEIEYKLFFPKALKKLRFLEAHMKTIFLGAQWRITAVK
ncbi:class I SAM-dependent methyltransferase [Diaphorobacter caeni]|uniref:class I SAM-dependent methyltransferase n=1 Tax=Diaphorobacter caeni TaxID=2784387 RepID=UPI00188E026B|nr:class I SAM-dependent methyltransferase [Diaphorobacter caeni]MBF5003869.1 class I SAM-dependent methyltransferase [Diaphorobacter caeni]